MPNTNFLEQLVAEWYEYNGFFVKRNFWYGEQGKGGGKPDMDVLAIHPRDKAFVHIETSGDMVALQKIFATISDKFENASDYYKKLVSEDFKIERIAVIAATQEIDASLKENRKTNFSTKTLLDLMREIVRELDDKNPASSMVPENWPILRGIQFALWAQKSKGEVH